MSNFSTQACYAVLSTYTSDGESPLQALLKMVVTLVDERKYAKIDPQDIMLALYVINSDKVTLAGVAKAISVRIRKYAYDEYSFDENEYERIKGELQSKNAEIADIQSELVEIADDLKRESAKVDDYSVDIDVIKLVTQSEK